MGWFRSIFKPKDSTSYEDYPITFNGKTPVPPPTNNYLAYYIKKIFTDLGSDTAYEFFKNNTIYVTSPIESCSYAFRTLNFLNLNQSLDRGGRIVSNFYGSTLYFNPSINNFYQMGCSLFGLKTDIHVEPSYNMQYAYEFGAAREVNVYLENIDLVTKGIFYDVANSTASGRLFSDNLEGNFNVYPKNTINDINYLKSLANMIVGGNVQSETYYNRIRYGIMYNENCNFYSRIFLNIDVDSDQYTIKQNVSYPLALIATQYRYIYLKINSNNASNLFVGDTSSVTLDPYNYNNYNRPYARGLFLTIGSNVKQCQSMFTIGLNNFGGWNLRSLTFEDINNFEDVSNMFYSFQGKLPNDVDFVFSNNTKNFNGFMNRMNLWSNDSYINSIIFPNTIIDSSNMIAALNFYNAKNVIINHIQLPSFNNRGVRSVSSILGSSWFGFSCDTIVLTDSYLSNALQGMRTTSDPNYTYPFEPKNIILSNPELNNCSGFLHSATNIENVNVIFNQKFPENTYINLYGMFYNCTKYNKLPIFEDNLNNVTTLCTSSMFYNCGNFNQNVSSLLQKTNSMYSMFYNCVNFNGDIGFSEILENSQINSFSSAFDSCYIFNRPIYNIYIDSKISSGLSSMFRNCKSYNHPCNIVINNARSSMVYMFLDCDNFNSQINILYNNANYFNVDGFLSDCYNFDSSVNIYCRNSKAGNIQMTNMFKNCYNFNSPLKIEITDFSNTAILNQAFWNCTNYNLPLNIVCSGNVLLGNNMFNGFGNNVSGGYKKTIYIQCDKFEANNTEFGRMNNANYRIVINANSFGNIVGLISQNYPEAKFNNIRIYCNNLDPFIDSNYHNGYAMYANIGISFSSTTNGYYNSFYHIYLYNNYPEGY